MHKIKHPESENVFSINRHEMKLQYLKMVKEAPIKTILAKHLTAFIEWL